MADKNYRLRVRKKDKEGRPVGDLSYPTNAETVDKLLKAGKVGSEAARVARTDAEADGKIKTVKAGDYCDDVPEVSRPWLLKQGLIEQVEATRGDLQQPRKDT